MLNWASVGSGLWPLLLGLAAGFTADDIFAFGTDAGKGDAALASAVLSSLL